MFCKNCGAQIDDKAVMCPRCGVATGKAAVVASTSAPALSPRQKNSVGLAGFILSLIAVGIPIFLMMPIINYLMFILAFPIVISALVCSAIGLKNVKKFGASKKGLATAGVVISSIMLGVVAVLVVLYIVGLILALTGALSEFALPIFGAIFGAMQGGAQ